MAGRAKIAFSLDPEVLAAVERLRTRTGESRSAVISRAIRQLTRADARARKVEQYVEAYRQVPETEADVAVARRLARQRLAGLRWDEDA